ncbi:hypothetical protein M1O50_06325, partial [Dehalococcoidia bacterium]|nr:hypothetical protein [Dehalococcoidia bacterium]
MTQRSARAKRLSIPPFFLVSHRPESNWVTIKSPAGVKRNGTPVGGLTGSAMPGKSHQAIVPLLGIPGSMEDTVDCH